MSAEDPETRDERYLWDRSGEPDDLVRDLERKLSPLQHRGELDVSALADRPGGAAGGAASGGEPAVGGRVVPIRRWWIGSAVLAAAAAAVLYAMSSSPPAPVTLAPDPAVVTEPGPQPPASAAAPAATPAGSGAVAAHGCDPSNVAGGMRFSSLEGSARCDGAVAAGAGVLQAGTWLETDEQSRVRLEVAEIGHVEVDKSSRVRVIETGETHRLELARGKLAARIDAPPRIFFVATKSATVVDLGCAYEIEVDDRGAGVLRVTSGHVELEPSIGLWGPGDAPIAPESPGRLASIVPKGAECAIDPEDGPGTPVWTAAPKTLRDAVRAFDAAPMSQGTLDAVLAGVGPRDTLTLVHLIERVREEHRATVLDRLERLHPRPRGAPRDKTLARSTSALRAWREALAKTW
jgi:ferric-dicitrate binding protein FerR (iron transport regulator)